MDSRFPSLGLQSQNLHFEFVSCTDPKESGVESWAAIPEAEENPILPLDIIYVQLWHNILHNMSFLLSSNKQAQSRLVWENRKQRGKQKTSFKDILTYKTTSLPSQDFLSLKTKWDSIQAEDGAFKASLCYLSRPCLTHKAREGKMVWWIKAFAGKPGGLRLIPGPYVMQRESRCLPRSDVKIFSNYNINPVNHKILQN